MYKMQKLVFIFILLPFSTAYSADLYTPDLPPTSQQLDYSPADGTTVTTNPPPFIWVSPKEGFEYILQIGARSDLSEISFFLQYKHIPVSTFAIKQALPPGTYYWRYGVQDQSKVQWSRVRSFIVPESAQKFVMPEIQTVIDAISRERPRLFITHDQLSAFRERAKNGDLKKAAQSLCQSCDRHIGEMFVPEPPFVEGTGPEHGKNYQKIFEETRPPMDQMESCALAYLLTGDEKYGQEAKRRILYFFGWDPHGSTAYAHNDEPAMWVMMRGTRAYDWTYDLFTSEEREKVETVMKIRAYQFYDHLKNRCRFHTDPYESHAGRTLGFLGETALSFAPEWTEASEWLDYVLTLYWNIYPAWGKEDGGWHEGPSYWSHYMDFALHFVVPLHVAAGVDLLAKPFFQNTPYYKLYTNPPYAKISPFGDGEHRAPDSGIGQIMYRFSSLLQNPYFRWYADYMKIGTGSSILDVVLKDSQLQAKSPVELPNARYFSGVGLVSLHSQLGSAENDIHFLIHSDPYGAISHAHADQNAFTLEAFGEALAIASGYYPWYGSTHHMNWQWQSKSSNTITFDGGIGQKIRDPNSRGRILTFTTNNQYDYVKADATQAYDGKLSRFIRHVVHIQPDIFVLYDEVDSPEEHTYEWWLHAFSEMKMDAEKGEILVSQGEARLYVKFLLPGNVKMQQKKGFDDPPEHGEPDQYHVIVTPKQKSSNARFFTVMIPYREGNESHPYKIKLEQKDNQVIAVITQSQSYSSMSQWVSFTDQTSNEEGSLFKLSTLSLIE